MTFNTLNTSNNTNKKTVMKIVIKKKYFKVSENSHEIKTTRENRNKVISKYD